MGYWPQASWLGERELGLRPTACLMLSPGLPPASLGLHASHEGRPWLKAAGGCLLLFQDRCSLWAGRIGLKPQPDWAVAAAAKAR